MSQLELTNHEYCQSTIKLKEAIEDNFLILGQSLMAIRDEQKYARGFTPDLDLPEVCFGVALSKF